jgi:hypothetical protein
MGTQYAHCEVRTEFLYMTETSFMLDAVTWLRQLVAGLSQWRPGFSPRPVRVRFMVDRVALGEVPRFSPVSITPLGEVPRFSPVSITPLGEVPRFSPVSITPLEEVPRFSPVSITPLGEVPRCSPVSITPLGEVPLCSPVSITPLEL